MEGVRYPRTPASFSAIQWDRSNFFRSRLTPTRIWLVNTLPKHSQFSRRGMIGLIGCVFTLCLLVATTVYAQQPDEAPLDAQHAEKMAAGRKVFTEHVRGVLIARCLDCHGGEETEGDFDISTREALLRGGVEGKAIVPGKAIESRMVKLITHEVAPEMPFDEAKLEDEEIAAIVKWIDLGAPYDKPLLGEDHEEVPWTERVIDPAEKKYWAFQPLAKVDPPQVKDKTWVRTAIDAFILQKLEEEKLSPNDLAEPRVLVRRLYYDLIGLPPTPDELDKWTTRLTATQREAREAEKHVDSGSISHTALEEMIDELLSSPHYGERWARHWLDVARFAESHGFEQDYDRPHAYHYRDFVIQALNQDMPYDQFVRWQIAGDEIAPENPLAMMATGFLGAGVFPTQLTEKEFESARYDELDDMVGTLGTSMLGLTIGCARCHDHKFDPIPQADYYRMVSTFRTTIRSEINIDLASGEKQLAARKEYDAKLADAVAKIAAFESDVLPDKFDAYLASLKSDDLAKSPWAILNVNSATSTAGTTLEKQTDGSLLKVGATPAKDTYTIVASSKEKHITAVRLEALTHESFPRRGPGLAGNGNFCLTDFRVGIRPQGSDEPFTSVELAQTRVTHEQDQGNLSAKASFDGDAGSSGWAVDRGGIGKDQAAVFIFPKPVGFDDGTEFSFTLRFDHPNTKHAMGRPRLAITSANPHQVALRDGESSLPKDIANTLTALAAGKKVADGERETARKWFASTLPQYQKLQTVLTDLKAKGPPSGKPTKVMVCSENVPKMKHHADGRGFPHFYPQSYYLKRGDANQKQDEAPIGYLQVLMRSGEAASQSVDPLELSRTWRIEPPSDATTSYRRRSLANWITDTDRGAGHLLARVIVNRIWHLHFGRGLVPTPNDFGAQAERPSHPGLLDWLASDFIAHGWQLKRLHKQILTSSVYLQLSQFDAAKAKIDPDNRLLWRSVPKRLEAEVIRDAMLATSGELDDTMFGPGTLNEGMKRRSIYFMIKRSKLIPMMQLFDQPEPLVSQGNRPATTIAPQALLFMNNPQVRQYARSLAVKLEPSAEDSMASAVQQGYRLTLSREASEEEVSDNVEFLKSQQALYEADGKANARQLALADFAQVLFSLNEFVFIE